jgi:hypothetical protein
VRLGLGLTERSATGGGSMQEGHSRRLAGLSADTNSCHTAEHSSLPSAYLMCPYDRPAALARLARGGVAVLVLVACCMALTSFASGTGHSMHVPRQCAAVQCMHGP